MVFTITENEDKTIHVNYEVDVYDWNQLKIVMEILDTYFGNCNE